MIKIKNISDANIIINKKVLLPGDEMELPEDDIEKYKKLFDNKMIEKILPKIKRIEQIELNEDQKQEYNELKERLLPAFFSLYLHQNINEQQLEDLKWFYKNVGLTSTVDIITKSLIDDINNDEELIEVLLNHIYPELLKKHFERFKN